MEGLNNFDLCYLLMDNDDEVPKKLTSTTLLEDNEQDEVLVRLLVNNLEYYNEHYCLKNSVHIASFTGHHIIHNMLNSHYRNCYDHCRVMPDIFVRLCSIFKQRGMLSSTHTVTVEEQMRIFLQTIGHGHENRTLQHNLQHSGETISRYFNVLHAMCTWASEIIRPKDSLLATPMHKIDYGGGK